MCDRLINGIVPKINEANMYLLTIQLKNQDIIDAFEALLLVSLLLCANGKHCFELCVEYSLACHMYHICMDL